jgi:hypothetical protein
MKAVVLFLLMGPLACQRAHVLSKEESGRRNPSGPGGAMAGGGSGANGTGGPGFTVPPPGSAGAPPPPAVTPGETCAAEAHAAERASVDLLFLVDVSTSMAKPVAGGTQSKWQAAQAALSGFLADAGSAGLNVGLQFFPAIAQCFDGICVGPQNPPGPTPPCPCPAGLTCMPTDPTMPRNCPGNPPSCEVGDYRKLAVPFGLLPAVAPALMTAVAGKDPRAATTSGTPTGPAVVGALEQLSAHVAASPGHRGALVLITDGEPTLCTPLLPEEIAGPVQAARQAAPSIATFVIGVFTPEDLAGGARAVTDRLAAAGGTDAFVIMPAEDLTRRLQEAFNQIRTLTIPCAFRIPTPRSGTVDYAKVNVHVTRAAADEDLPYVQTEARCHPTRGGWYYDADPATGGSPTQVIMCPASCKSLEGDEMAKVDLRFGCRTRGVD